MKISYEFEGFDLTQWAEFGGLPVHVHWADDGGWSYERLWAYDDCQTIFSGDSYNNDEYFEFELRYSTLSDVIEEAPERAKWFAVDGGGKTYWYAGMPIEDKEQMGKVFVAYGELKEIKGHLFNPEDYPEPVNLKEWKEANQ